MTDSFDLCPQWNRFYPARYATHAINLLELLRQANGYVPRFAAVPDERNVAVPARRSYEGQVWLQPGSIIWGLRGSSEQTDGFRAQLTDAGTGERFFQTPMRIDPPTAEAIPNQMWILPEPHLVVEPGLVTAQLTNLSDADSALQLVIYYAEPVKGTQPNAAAAELQLDAASIRTLRARGAFQAAASGSSSYSSIGAAPSDPPYLVPPPTHVPFREGGSVATPAAGSGAQVVLSFTVPTGFDGTIRGLSNQYTGPAFVEGAGDLIWRIRVNGAYQKGYDRITTTLGNAAQPQEIQGAIRVYSGQLVEYTVEHAAASALPAVGTQVICTMSGWFWPKG